MCIAILVCLSLAISHEVLCEPAPDGVPVFKEFGFERNTTGSEETFIRNTMALYFVVTRSSAGEEYFPGSSLKPMWLIGNETWDIENKVCFFDLDRCFTSPPNSFMVCFCKSKEGDEYFLRADIKPPLGYCHYREDVMKMLVLWENVKGEGNGMPASVQSEAKVPPIPCTEEMNFDLTVNVLFSYYGWSLPPRHYFNMLEQRTIGVDDLITGSATFVTERYCVHPETTAQVTMHNKPTFTVKAHNGKFPNLGFVRIHLGEWTVTLIEPETGPCGARNMSHTFLMGHPVQENEKVSGALRTHAYFFQVVAVALICQHCSGFL